MSVDPSLQCVQNAAEQPKTVLVILMQATSKGAQPIQSKLAHRPARSCQSS